MSTNTNSADLGAANTNKSLSKASDLGITHQNTTFSMWVKLRAEIAGGTWEFFSIRTSLSTNYIDWHIRYEYNSGTRRLTFVRGKPGVTEQQATYNLTMGTSNWYLITMTYDTATITGYVNGASVATAAASGIGTGGATNFYLGYDGTTNYSSILLDDVRVYDTALGSSTISGFYTSPSELAGNETNLRAYYTFNSTLTADLTANAYTLTNNNSVTQSVDIPFVGGRSGNFLPFL